MIDFTQAHRIARIIRPHCTSYRAAFKLACLELQRPKCVAVPWYHKMAAALTFAANVVLPSSPIILAIILHYSLSPS